MSLTPMAHQLLHPTGIGNLLGWDQGRLSSPIPRCINKYMGPTSHWPMVSSATLEDTQSKREANSRL
jgi:hypothetical protein